MSSILEALRELEGAKPPSSRSRVAWAGGGEERPPLRRAAEALGIVAFGLGLGAAGFGLVLWLGAPDAPEPATPPAVASATAAGTTVAQAPHAASRPALAPAAPAPPIPAWLARMGPPRGRVDAEVGAHAAGTETRADEQTSVGAPGLALVDVRYAESRGQRTATLRIDGSPVVLREGESAHGIEVQLVTRDGAYVRRGAEVLMLERPR